MISKMDPQTTTVQEDLEDALLAMQGAVGPTQGRQLFTNASRTTWIFQGRTDVAQLRGLVVQIDVNTT